MSTQAVYSAIGTRGHKDRVTEVVLHSVCVNEQDLEIG